MPVLLADELQSLKSEGMQPMLVFSSTIYSMGIAVDEIVDVIEGRLDIEFKSDRAGLVGTAVIGGAATEILDVDHFLLMGLAEQHRADQPEGKRVAA